MNDQCLLAVGEPMRAVEGHIEGWIHRWRGDWKLKKSNLKSLKNPVSNTDEEVENLIAKETNTIEEPQRKNFEW
jgi:hypothetical protein